MGLNKRDIRDKKEEYLHGGYLYFGRVLFGIGLVSNRSTFKYPSTFLPPGGGGVPHLFYRAQLRQSYRPNPFRPTEHGTHHVENELIDSPLQHDACLITA